MSKAKRKVQARTASTAVPIAEGRPEARGRAGGGDFKPDYTHVVNDLRRIGLLAGALILGLIVLSFFLR